MNTQENNIIATASQDENIHQNRLSRRACPQSYSGLEALPRQNPQIHCGEGLEEGQEALSADTDKH